MGRTVNTEMFSDPARLLAGRTAEEVVAWAVREYGRGLTMACSFSDEDMMVLDMLVAVDPGASVFVIDTGRLHQETHDLIEDARRHYRRDFDFFAPDAGALEALLREIGPNGFYASADARRACCQVRKVQPLARALAGRRAWLTGLRREQAVTRADLTAVEPDPAHGGILRISPLAGWSEAQVWTAVAERGLPRNRLYDLGYRSIGCAPCTRAVRPGEGVRAGRWWWEAPEKRECGLHARRATPDRAAQPAGGP